MRVTGAASTGEGDASVMGTGNWGFGRLDVCRVNLDTRAETEGEAGWGVGRILVEC